MNTLITIVLLTLSLKTIAEPNVSFNCRYYRYSDNGELKYSDWYLKIIVNEGKAFIIGNRRSSEVKLIRDVKNSIYSFIETNTAGYVISTTIDKNLKSVHSRNIVSLGKIAPQQFYGRCEKVG